MARRRLLLLLKPFDIYPLRPRVTSSSSLNRTENTQPLQILNYLEDRRRVHREAIDFCQDVLRCKDLDWEPVFRNNLSQRIHGVDLVVTIGGDGTLLQASHFLDHTVPVLGVNSDPTRKEEVEQLSSDFDATRSTGYLCAATVANFEQVLDDILKDKNKPLELSRMSINVNGQPLLVNALNDVLIAHPCPATVSRLSFRIRCKDWKSCSLINCRSSGLRVCTAAGSTAAMLSAGGFPMPVSSCELQYMVREPISPRTVDVPLMHGVVKPGHTMHISWYCNEGTIYIDGSHVLYPIRYGDVVELSTQAPILKVYLPHRLLR